MDQARLAIGVRSSSQYFNGTDTALSFKSLDTDIDLNTGLVKASPDTSLIQTDYEYDAMGRLAWVKPATGHAGTNDAGQSATGYPR